MPRSKALMNKRAAGSTSGGTGTKKIIIKPFSKPPTLPPNYYEMTSQALLQGTMDIIFSPNSTGESQQEQTTTTTTLSLQNSYQQVVNLVSHQYGPRLYRDLVDHFRKACQIHVLAAETSHMTTTTMSGGSITTSLGQGQSPHLLSYVQVQYQKYVDYLLLCRHVFLPLDRTHAWTSDGTVLKRSASTPVDGSGAGGGASSGGTGGGNTVNSSNHNHNNNSSGGSSHATMGLWQVGLDLFRLRLQDFQLDDKIYQKWWECLQLDWDNNLGLEEQSMVHQTVYMWQDLGILSETLSRMLEPDLIRFFQSRSQELKTSMMTMSMTSTSTSTADRGYNSAMVISYCHSKWMHVAYHWSRFLPKQICIHLLENYLFKPHLDTEWLLSPTSFDPLIDDVAQGPTTPLHPTLLMSTSLSTMGGSSTTATTTTTSSTPIQQLWMLAGRLPGGYKLVGGAIAQYARSRGLAMMKTLGDSKVGKLKMGELLDLQAHVRQLLSQLSQAAEHCGLKNVWEDVVNPTENNNDGNNDTNTVAEALAKYVDAYLKDAKQQGPDSTNWATNIISGIFCYLQAKDIFEAFYKRDLAKRLLWNRIVSMDVERNFVSLLKAECGAGYTAKMEGMFQDMDWSRETMTLYKQTDYQDGGSSSYSGGDKVDMDIQVLTTGYWPVYPQFPKLILPASLTTPQEHFAEYYKTKYQGRRMTWQYALGHCAVRFQSDLGRTYDLVVSLCQALVLIQFNSDQEFKLSHLMSATGLEDRDEMERILQSLSLGKDGTRVLQKLDYDATPDKKKKTRMNVHDDDTFRVQSNFKSNSRRIRITNILMKETKEERDKTVEAVSLDRLYLIDAVLVRIMKARKTILHQQLIPQVMEQLKVPAQPADIKKRIESLIEREYMERDQKERNRYNYLA